ncbi:hypothetical protein SAMN03080617_03661 [Algoriphagus alkaliphilus]|uniref:Uncharacterized protein n=1 Tax=Algoriphagus alkaliphilus TaxID=279824 RepID=A0A1G5ZER5_9BACT|nr:hypothetical protein SAMN03080617_03661 [Algoriphagus alkaliphilus]
MGSKNGQLDNRELIDMFTKLRILTGNSVLDKFMPAKWPPSLCCVSTLQSILSNKPV